MQGTWSVAKEDFDQQQTEMIMLLDDCNSVVERYKSIWFSKKPGIQAATLCQTQMFINNLKSIVRYPRDHARQHRIHAYFFDDAVAVTVQHIISCTRSYPECSIVETDAHKMRHLLLQCLYKMKAYIEVNSCAPYSWVNGLITQIEVSDVSMETLLHCRQATK
jgi:hypothetical protein